MLEYNMPMVTIAYLKTKNIQDTNAERLSGTKTSW
jgi:hypothetical protein